MAWGTAVLGAALNKVFYFIYFILFYTNNDAFNVKIAL